MEDGSTKDDSSTISSRLSFFSSSGSNSVAASESNLVHNVKANGHDSTSHKPASCSKPQSKAKSSSMPRLSASKEDLKGNESKYGQSGCVSPSQSNSSLCSSDGHRAFTESMSDHAQNGDHSETESMSSVEKFRKKKILSETLTISMKDDSFVNSSTSIQEPPSPSASSTDSRSSLGSTKKASKLRALKDQIKQKIKGRMSPSKKDCKVSKTDSEDERGDHGKADRMTSSNQHHLDHNYFQHSFGVDDNSNYVDSRKVHLAAQTGPISWRVDNQSRQTSQSPVVVPRTTLPDHAQQSRQNVTSDVLEKLKMQSSVKQWDGSRVTVPFYSNHSFSDSKSAGRQYDEFDSEIDRGHVRKRKSFDVNHQREYNQGGYNRGFHQPRGWGNHNRSHTNPFQNYADSNRHHKNHYSSNNSHTQYNHGGFRGAAGGRPFNRGGGFRPRFSQRN